VSGPRRRVLVSVEPRILRDSLERLLESSGIDEVVAVAPGQSTEGTFDGAIVSSVPDVLDADVVIELPDSTPNQITLHTSSGDELIDLRDVGQLIDLLDQHAPHKRP
jgi:hypothetical protein